MKQLSYLYPKYIYMQTKEERRLKQEQYDRTKNGLSTQIYAQQRSNSKRRGHEIPTYTSKELRAWLFAQPDFEPLFIMWEMSDYSKWERPSCDRDDENFGYSFDNITLMTWRENLDKQYQKALDAPSKGNVYYDKNNKRYVVKIGVNRKIVHIASSKDKQVCIDALKEWKKNN